MSVIRDLFTSSVNSTMMSMNERFTYLQKNAWHMQPTVMAIRANNAALQQASAKNRRLAMQMERRLSATPALKTIRVNTRKRLGTPLVIGGQRTSVKDRLTLPARGKGKLSNVAQKRMRGRSLRRSQSMQSLSGGNLQRSRSMQSLNNEVAVPHRSRSRSRTRNSTPSFGPKENIARRRRSSSGLRQGRVKKTNTGFFKQQGVTSQRRRRSNSVNFRNNRGKNIGNQVNKKNQLEFKRGGQNGGNFQSNRGSFRGRGGRGRGRGRGGLTRNVRGNRSNKAGNVPTKEELDKELEQYMANTKSRLDEDIDTFMKVVEGTDMWD